MITLADTYYVEGSESLLDDAGPLWECLNEQHAAHSDAFRHWFLGRSFSDRKQDLLKKAHGGSLHTVLAREQGTDRVTGYCISTVDSSGGGEVDSLFVVPEYRRHKIGDRLTRMSLDWLRSEGATRIVISVAAGNESVLDFYARYGFRPRTIVLHEVMK